MERWFRFETKLPIYVTTGSSEDEQDFYADADVMVDAGIAAEAIALADGEVYGLCEADRRDHYDSLAVAAITAIGGEPV